MADIAILVAEEYEKRVKNSRKAGGEGQGDMEVNWVSCVSVIAQGIKNKMRQGNMDLVKWALEPKSQIGDAAFNGFFSA